MSNRKLKISIGSDDFLTVRTESDFFVDNTEFIMRIIDSGEIAQIITMPRRMGKSLNLSMLKYFLALEVDNEGNKLATNSFRKFFEGGTLELAFNRSKELEKLKIASIDNGNYMNYQGQYPVIFFSFKDIVGDTSEKIKASLTTHIHRLYKEYSYLANSLRPELQTHKEELNKYLKGDIDDALLTTSLSFLSKLLYIHHSQKVYILVDEYDKPANSFYENVNYFLQGDTSEQNKEEVKVVTMLITSLLASAGKGNNYLEKFIGTGIFDSVKKDGTSGFNNVVIHGITDPAYSDCFGFSESEVDQLVAKLELTNLTDLVTTKMREWYDGYTLPQYNGKTIDTYTPWSVLNYLSESSKNIFAIAEAKSFWSKTGPNKFLQSLLQPFIHHHLIEKFHLLTQGKEQILDFDELTSLFNLNIKSKSHAEQVFAYLLVNAGYLTVRKEGSNYYFKIPNLEVKKEFVRVIETELQDLSSKEADALVTFAAKQYSVKKLLTYTLTLFEEEKSIKKSIEVIIASKEDLIQNQFSFKCNDLYANFNVFHIAALIGNQTIIEHLLNICDNRLLDSPDNIFKLKPADYSYLSKKQILPIIETLELEQPKWYHSFACSEWNNNFITTMASVLISGLVPLGLKLYGAPREASSWQTYWKAIPVFAATQLLNLIFQNNKPSCEEFKKYSLINTSRVEDFYTLLQFEKYKLEGHNAYVTLNQSCDGNDSNITSIEAQMFDFPISSLLTFTLCEPLDSSKAEL